MRTSIRRLGNSRGIILPKPLLSQLNLGAEVDLSVEADAIVLRKPRKRVRVGWAQAGERLAKGGDHVTVWPQFSNTDDTKLRW